MLNATDLAVCFLCLFAGIAGLLHLSSWRKGGGPDGARREAMRRKREFRRIVNDSALQAPETRRAMADAVDVASSFRSGRR